MRAELHDGADAIKIFAGSIQAHSFLMMQLDRAQAIVKEAHRLHHQVFEHPTNLAGVDIALASGVDVLAHVTSQLGEDWTPGLNSPYAGAKDRGNCDADAAGRHELHAGSDIA